MLKTQIGLGVLSIPEVFHALGLIPGVICLLVIAAMTSWSNYIIGVFKRNHPDVYGIDDVGRKLFGRVGYEFFGITFALCKSSQARGQTLQRLILTSLDFRWRLWNARHCNGAERSVFPWNLYCGLRRRGGYRRLWLRQHSNIGSHLLACLDRCG